MLRHRSHLWPAALLALLLGSTASAQLIPWSEPPALLTPTPAAPAPRSARRANLPQQENLAAIPVALPPSEGSVSFGELAPAPLVLTSFAATDVGSIRAGTSWIGQVTQNSSSITVGGTAADDNGWGATGLSFNASGYNSLSITAQRGVGNATPTLFLQFEDRSLRTKIIAVSTSLFAIGTPTTVQIPLTGWTVDFGSNDISGWSLGGGNIGTVALRLTFDEIAFTTTSAIPEPSTYAALLGALSLTLAWRRRVAAALSTTAGRLP